MQDLNNWKVQGFGFNELLLVLLISILYGLPLYMAIIIQS
jgi:hypothetical protein